MSQKLSIRKIAFCFYKFNILSLVEKNRILKNLKREKLTRKPYFKGLFQEDKNKTQNQLIKLYQ